MGMHGFDTLNGHLMIGSFRVEDLARQFKTPLYLMDESKIRLRMRLFKNTFKKDGIDTEVLYASKAFLTKAMVQVVEQEGLGLDVVSGGELYTAIQAGFPLEKMYFHGNNKSRDELEMAIEQRVGTIVLDNALEAETLSSLLPDGQIMRVMLRVNPGIEAHTHAYIATTTSDSKFGVDLSSEDTLDLIKKLATNPKFHFVGLHCHIGSQILDGASYHKEAEVLLDYLKNLKEASGITIKELNLGGGYGVRYTQKDEPIDLKNFLPELIDKIESACHELRIDVPKLIIEPGRSIVAEAGLSIYEIGGIKTTSSGKSYVMVDGSMADAIRPALYQADYDAVLVSKTEAPSTTHYSIAGKACESGDILIRDISLPEVTSGDFLAVFSTGAYHYSMASNYNRFLKPAVVFVNGDLLRCVVKRESYADLIRNDISL
jgi:diaminopimelate decarboxylase